MIQLPTDRAVAIKTKLSHRSAVANGTRLFVDGLDGRSALARRNRDLIATFTIEIGGDPSETQKQLIRRAASMSVWCEAVEAKLINGEDVDIGQLTTVSNSLRRILQDIGLERATKDVTPSIEQYMSFRAGEKRTEGDIS